MALEAADLAELQQLWHSYAAAVGALLAERALNEEYGAKLKMAANHLRDFGVFRKLKMAKEVKWFTSLFIKVLPVLLRPLATSNVSFFYLLATHFPTRFPLSLLYSSSRRAPRGSAPIRRGCCARSWRSGPARTRAGCAGRATRTGSVGT